jgi:hypothetical protein
VDEICDGTLIGYKYFAMEGVTKLRIAAMLDAEEGTFEVRLEEQGPAVGEIRLSRTGEVWTTFEGNVSIPDGVHALYLVYHGEGLARLLSFELA